MRFLLILVLICFVNGLNAQKDTLFFTPKWKRGDQRQVRFSVKEQTFEKGKLKTDTSYFYSAKYTVRSVDDTGYLFFIQVPNVALKSVLDAYSKVSKKYRGFRNLELLYRVDKSDGSFELTNFEEVKAYMSKSMQDLEKLFTEMVPDEAETAISMLAPIKGLMEKEEVLAAFVYDYIHFIQYPFGKSFIEGDTLRTISKAANPLNPVDTLSQADLFFVEKGNYSNYNVTHVSVIDKEAFNHALIETVRVWNGSISMDSIAKMPEINLLEMEVSTQIVVEYSTTTSWPRYARQESEVKTENTRIVKIVNYTLQ